MDNNAPFPLDAEELKKYQPNRYPFLMIDRVTEVLPGRYAKGIKADPAKMPVSIQHTGN